MVCRKCGTQNLNDAMFSKNCGTHLDGRKKVAANTTAKVKDATQPQHKCNAPRSQHCLPKTIVIISVVAIVLILTFVLLGDWRSEPIQIFLRVGFPDQACGEYIITVMNCRLTRLLVSLIQKAF